MRISAPGKCCDYILSLQNKMDSRLTKYSRWFFASSLFPMIAGTLGPVASAFSICALARPWQQSYPPGSDIQKAKFIKDPTWLDAVNGAQLGVAIIANMALLLNMTKKLRFNIAQPITIVGWYFSAICLIVLECVCTKHLRRGEYVWSQAFYYGIYAAVLYFIVATLMVVTFWGATSGHYENDFLLTMSQRTLMMQTIMFLMYLLIGALVFANIEGWDFLDAVYWADVTLFTVGFGDFAPATTLGRALLLPYALIGVISLGLVIGSIRSLLLDRGKRRIEARVIERSRRRVVKKLTKKGRDTILEPIPEGEEESRANDDTPESDEKPERRLTELERRQKEFELMRDIQRKADWRRRWVAMATSTGSWLVLWLVGAKIFQECEEPYQGWDYFDGVYLGFVSLTTIGYGDLTPISNPGKSFFVFWSLLALPTMTILISHAGDTVVKGIRDVTDIIGSVTILPGEQGFRKAGIQLLQRVTLGKLFEEDIKESPPGFHGDAEEHVDSDGSGDGNKGDSEHYGGRRGGMSDQRELDAEKATTRKADKERAEKREQDNTGRDEGLRSSQQQQPPSEDSARSSPSGSDKQSAPRRASTMDSLQKKPSRSSKNGQPGGRRMRRTSSIPRDNLPRDLPQDEGEYHVLLIEEIARVKQHLKSQPPRRYTWDEWTWYLKLIGEDEANPATHRKVQPHMHDKQRKREKARDDDDKTAHRDTKDRNESAHGQTQWSWVGARSPLMGSQEEAEWILEKLTQKLTQELKAVRNRKQQGGGEDERDGNAEKERDGSDSTRDTGDETEVVDKRDMAEEAEDMDDGEL